MATKYLYIVDVAIIFYILLRHYSKKNPEETYDISQSNSVEDVDSSIRDEKMIHSGLWPNN